MRTLLAGVVGAIAMFLWSFVAHMALPLGEAGIKQISEANEPAVLNAMQSGIGNAPGMYLFPGTGGKRGSEAMKGYQQKLNANPSGLLIYHPAGLIMKMPLMLGREFLTEFFEALVLAWMLTQTRFTSYLGRVGFASVVGILAAVVTNIPYWNWYGFPCSYTAAYMTMEIVAFLAAGLAIAALIRPKA